MYHRNVLCRVAAVASLVALPLIAVGHERCLEQCTCHPGLATRVAGLVSTHAGVPSTDKTHIWASKHMLIMAQVAELVATLVASMLLSRQELCDMIDRALTTHRRALRTCPSRLNLLTSILDFYLRFLEEGGLTPCAVCICMPERCLVCCQQSRMLTHRQQPRGLAM